MTKQQLEMIAATLICLVGSGCQTMREHPKTTAFIAGSLVLTAGGAFRHDHSDADRHIDTPSVSCDSGACR